MTGASDKSDRAGGLRPEPVAPSQPKALIPCAVCKVDLANPYGSMNQPCGGTEFITPGHYGSAVSDLMDGSTLVLNVCDPCLRDLRAKKMVGRYAGGKFKKWAKS